MKTNPRHPRYGEPGISLMNKVVVEMCQNFVQSNKRGTDDDVSSGGVGNSSSTEKKPQPDTVTVKDPVVLVDTGKQQSTASEGPNKEYDIKMVTKCLWAAR